MAALLQSRDSGQQGQALKRGGGCLEEACKRVKGAPELSQHSSYDSITSEDFALGGAACAEALFPAVSMHLQKVPAALHLLPAVSMQARCACDWCCRTALRETAGPEVMIPRLCLVQVPWACGGRALLT